MGFWEWLLKPENIKPAETVKEPPKEIKTRKYYKIEYVLNFKEVNGNYSVYHNTMKTYDYDEYLNTHKLCNERTIKNTAIINEHDDDKFVVLDCGVNVEDLVTMKRSQFVSCVINNGEHLESYTE